MATGSFIGWIDMLPDDLNRAREYLRRLEEGTLDELGFGIIRDYFSEQFFPATSTVMTIARQYVLAPFCCMHIERRIFGEKWDLSRARRELYDMENHLRACVGRIQRKDVLRMPSVIFWPALRKLGIFTDHCSIYTYLRRLVEDSGGRYRDDDSGGHTASDEISQWDPGIINLYEKEKDRLIDGNRFSFENPADINANASMTRDEANYVRSVYLRHAEKTPSIMSHILRSGIAPAGSLPWELDHPDELRPDVRNAQCFSLLVCGARLIYFQLLIEERRKRGLPDFEDAQDYEEFFSIWWDVSRARLKAWDIGAFLVRVKLALRPSPRNDRQFLSEFFDRVTSASRAREIFQSDGVREMIRDRERRVRPQKSRLRNQKYLEQWDPNSVWIGDLNFPYAIDYRGRIATRLCGEIIDGLNSGKRHG